MIGRIGLAAVLVCAAAAVVPAGAWGGGWATVGLESPPPRDVAAGHVWEARFTVLAHGRTPMDHLKPVVRIERVDGDGQRTFSATKVGAPGTYRARVAFPAEGRWAVEVAEHRAIAGSPVAGHSFGTVHVGSTGGAQASGGRSWPVALALTVALGLLAAGGAWLALARLRASRSTAETG